MKVLSESFPELGPAVLETPLRILLPNGTFMFSDRYIRGLPIESTYFVDLTCYS